MRGHKSQEDWVAGGGDPDQWMPAEQFLEMAEERKGAYHAQLRAMEKNMAEMQRRMERQDKFMEQNIALAREQAEADLKAAVDTGDQEAAAKALKKRDDLNAPQEEAPQVDPAVQDFEARNSWFGQDDVLTATAMGLSSSIAQRMPHLTVEQNLQAVEEQMKQRGLLNADKPKPRPTPVEPGRKRMAAPKQSGFNSLEADHKENFKDMVRQGYYENTDDGKQKYFDSVQKYNEMKEARRG
jgi:hypothetical protein